MITIVIVDDHPMVREGLEAMLLTERGFKVNALAEDGEDAVFVCKANKPDIVLCDIRMPGDDGFAILAKLKKIHPDIKVLMLAGMPLKDEEARARELGAKGYLPKSVDIRILVSAIRDIAAGGDFVSEEFISAPSLLSSRELEVLKLLASGKQRDEIAAVLGIGSESVKTHLKGIMTKLDCPNATSSVGKAYELGILRP
ncbi:MAG: response regulator transcription factor [Kiritimatiellae bacterium]|nr:response regulator transcription factor [Kiritimatiellia bacterium]